MRFRARCQVTVTRAHSHAPDTLPRLSSPPIFPPPLEAHWPTVGFLSRPKGRGVIGLRVSPLYIRHGLLPCVPAPPMNARGGAIHGRQIFRIRSPSHR